MPFFVCCVAPATLHAWMGSLWITASGLSVTDAGIKDTGAGCRCSGGTAVSWSVLLLQLVANVLWGLTALLCSVVIAGVSEPQLLLLQYSLPHSA